MTRTEFLNSLYGNIKAEKREKHYESDLFRLGAEDHPDSWLHAAVIHANDDLVEKLLNQGADVNRVIDGDSVLGSILPMDDFDPFLEVIENRAEPVLNTEVNDPAKIFRTVQVLLNNGAKSIKEGKQYDDAQIQQYFQYFKEYYSL